MINLPRFRTPLLAAVVIALTCSAPAAAQVAARSAETIGLNEVVPIDPQIRMGTLPNGLRYFIRANRQPRNRAELRLVVNAGSVLEDENQRGLAHFVEHMCFNGTKNFPRQSVVTFVQSLGMRFGAHVNAHTSFDETVFQLQIPTDNEATIDRAMLIFEDFAHNVTFDASEIEKERGVILEEWRLGLGADGRMQDVQFPIVLKGSKYAERLPIGKPEIIRSFSYETLKKFYTDWYRPDLMAVIAVGDFDPAAVEGMIKSHFGPIPMPASPRPRPAVDVPDHAETLYAVATDPEANATTVGVMSTMAFRDQTTVGAYRRIMAERLMGATLSARLDEIARQPDAPFLAAQSSRGLFVRAAEATSLNSLVPENGIERGLTALITEAERASRLGFTAAELDRQRLNLERGLQRSVVEKDAQESRSLADEYVRHVTTKEPIPGIVYEYALHRRFLPEISLAEINELAKNWVTERNRVVVISAPRKPGLVVPDEKTLAATITSATGARLTTYVDGGSNVPLLDKPPAPGTVASTSAIDSIGITEWRLSNGVRVVLKPTTFKQDEILFRAVSPGGTSLASDRDYVAAETAADVIARGGVGQLSDTALERLLAGKTAFVRPDIGDAYEGLRGAASRRDLETMFQLIYLTFTQPRADPDAFRRMVDQLSAALANRQALPEAAFSDALEDALSQGHLRARSLTPAMLAQMDLDKSYAFYRDRFADASDFTFVFVGSFDLPTMKPLVERYLGSLPALNRREASKDVGIRPPSGVVNRTVRKGIDPKGMVGVVFTGPFQNDQLHRIIMRVMAETLEGNLQRTLREDLGGTYGVTARPEFDKDPVPSYQLAINFTCDPARLDALVTSLFQVIDQFRFQGPGTAQVADARAALARDLETNMRENAYLLNQITFKYQYGEDVRELFNLQADYDRLTVNAVRDAARMYLDLNRYVKVTLFPEGK